jgi:hypothetical protein
MLFPKPVVYDEDKSDEIGLPRFTYPLSCGNLDAETQFPDRVREEFAEASLASRFLSSCTRSNFGAAEQHAN